MQKKVHFITLLKVLFKILPHSLHLFEKWQIFSVAMLHDIVPRKKWGHFYILCLVMSHHPVREGSSTSTSTKYGKNSTVMSI